LKKAVTVFLMISFLPVLLLVPASASVTDYPHYLEENESRYEAYRALNPGLPYDMVIAYVNANVDKGCYNDISMAENLESMSVLVNKNFSLPSNYKPRDLVLIDSSHRIRSEAAKQFLKMKADLAALGYKIYVMSAYRTYSTQTSKYYSAVKSYGTESADQQYARPGHSEHQTGLAVDIVQKTTVKSMTQARFEETREFAWLKENAYKYGFILRYPEEYTNIHGFMYEPWHWRYVGADIATAMYNDGIIMLEEYYGWYLAPGVITKTEKERLLRLSPLRAE